MRVAAVFLSALILAGPAGALSSPVLSNVLPRGGQRGTEVDVVLSGSLLKDACELMLYKPGIRVLAFEVKGDGAVHARLKIAPDAEPGEHPLRLRTSTGVSDLRTFYVGLLPSHEEKEPNNLFKEPQKIPLGVTVTGVVTNEDVDCFAVELKKGQRFTAEIEGIRLGTTLFDPHLSILDAKRFELVSSDDTPLLLQDSIASFLAPEDGTYVLQVRDSSYGGSPNAHYRLHVGDFPRPRMVYPAGGPAGTALEATFVGDVAGPIRQTIQLGPVAERQAVWARQGDAQAPSPNWVRVSPFPNVLEAEPNDEQKDATPVGQDLPVALNGIIETEGDQDWFRFKARKGEAYDIRVHARSLRSPLDATLSVHVAGQPNALAFNDDQGGVDSLVKFRAPADGEYELRIRDHLGRGGPTFVYRVEFGGTVPSVYAHIPAYDRTPRDQYRQWVVVPKGNRFATWVRVNRTDVGGAFHLEFKGLPPGIRAICDPVGANVDRTLVVFEADADAPVAGALAEVVARHADPAVKVEGGFRHEANLVYGQPNNTVYYASLVDRLPVAVAEEAPFTLDLVEPKAPLVKNGVMDLKVVARRKPGFTKPITLSFLWAPPGIGAQGRMTMPEGQSEFHYPINANRNAGVQPWKIAVLGSADGGHGILHASTGLATLRVEEPYVAMKLQMANVEQGKPVELKCVLEHLRPFDGKAQVVLQGLPPGVSVEPAFREITKDDVEIVFTAKTSDNSPAGQHKSLFGQITLTIEGEPVVHTVAGGGILRIDKPRTGKPTAAATPDAKVNR